MYIMCKLLSTIIYKDFINFVLLKSFQIQGRYNRVYNN